MREMVTLRPMTAIICQSCGAGVPPGFKFCGACGAKLDTPAEAQPVQAAPQTASQARDEFRDVTVLFADVTGFTAMSERLDPETMHRLMNACFEGLGSIVQANGGHIDKYIGDSIMALFGAPTAHEDDPVRAAETAIEMQKFLVSFAAAHARTTGTEFKIRIGINSGLVLAGSIGVEGRRDYSVMGDAVNVASRLEAAARPGTILVSAGFKRRVETQFAFGPVVELKLKGKEREFEAFELLGESFPGVSPSTPAGNKVFAGRGRELALLRTSLARAPDGKSLWIEIRGPLGIGKSRLADAAFDSLPAKQALRIVARPATRMRPFALARRMLFAVCQRLGSTGHLPQSRDVFEAALQPIGRNLEPYWSALWYLAAPDALGLKTPDPDPLTFRRTVDRGLAQLLSNLAEFAPSLVLYLDAYDLADAETRSFFEAQLGAGGRGLPPVIATVRGDAAPSKQTTREILLTRLSGGDARLLLDQLSQSLQMSEALKRDILSRADGVPLFIEELVRKVAEDQAAKDMGTAADDTSWSAGHAALPNSLLGVMISRLDRLDTARRDLISSCAVQGVEFSRAVAAKVWQARGGDPVTVPDILADLEQRQLVQRQDASDERWSFAQVLMQNACYDSMLKRDRRILHRDVASALVEGAGGAHGVSAETLASHYELSEQWMQAACQNLKAGDRAAEVYANSEALARYGRALKAVRELAEDGPGERGVHYAGHRGASLVHLRVGNYFALETHAGLMRSAAADAAAEAEADRLEALGRLHRGDMERAEALLAGAKAKISRDLLPGRNGVASEILYDLADLSYRRGRNAAALKLIASCRELLAGTSPNTLRLDILEGRVAHTEGRFHDAVRFYEHAHRNAASAGSLSEEALTSNYMGNAARDVGHYGEAEAYFTRALEIWQRTGMTESIAGAHNNLANLAISRGDPDRATYHYKAALDAFGQIGNAAGTALSLTNLAILAIETGAFETAVTRADEAKSQLLKSGNRVLLGLCAVVKGEALLDCGRPHEAKSEFLWVLEAYDDTNHPLAIAGAERGMGRVAIETGRGPDAQDALERALELYTRLAREQEAARTELYLARAYHLAGNRTAASTKLESARRRFKAIGAIHDLDRAEKLSFEA